MSCVFFIVLRVVCCTFSPQITTTATTTSGNTESVLKATSIIQSNGWTRAVYTHVYRITQNQASSIQIQFAWMVHNERTTNCWLPHHIIIALIKRRKCALCGANIKCTPLQSCKRVKNYNERKTCSKQLLICASVRLCMLSFEFMSKYR